MSEDARERAEQRTLLMPRPDTSGPLPPGHPLQEFVIERVLGTGGCSIVYLAYDTRLKRRVAVKEFLPGTLAARLSTLEVVPRLPRFEDLYRKGLQGFMNEARMLGAFDHPGLVKVYRCWEQAGTAYLAMPYYEGVTLQQWLADLGTPPSERWLRDLAELLLDALQALHAQGCCHRDVAPDNILLLYDPRGGAAYLEQRPRPVLLDLGAARRLIGDATQNLTAMLKSGYSPVEQYEGEASLRQGPWSDLYALCAVLYRAAVGRTPGSSIARVVRDDLQPAREAARGRYGEAFLAAIDAGLAVRPQDRPQSVPALRAWLEGRAPPLPVAAAAPAAPAAAPASPERPFASPQPARQLPWATVGVAVGVAALVVALGVGLWWGLR